jgi:hypothetical protein
MGAASLPAASSRLSRDAIGEAHSKPWASLADTDGPADLRSASTSGVGELTLPENGAGRESSVAHGCSAGTCRARLQTKSSQPITMQKAPAITRPRVIARAKFTAAWSRRGVRADGSGARNSELHSDG